jgi:hypothetical protein
MQSQTTAGLGKRSAVCATVLTLALLIVPAAAADAVFPTGSRVGLVPPPGMVANEAFDGFSDPSKDAAILITVLPAAAYPQIERTLDLDALRRQGVSLAKREPMRLAFGKGFLLSGRQVTPKAKFRKWLLVAAASDLTALVTVQVPDQDTTYSDRVVRTALATVAVRAKVPETEELGLLPFSVGDLAGFRVDDVVRGRALLLKDAAIGADAPGDGGQKPNQDPNKAAEPELKKDAGKESVKEPAAESGKQAGGFEARFLIAAVPGGPAEPDDRANFARLSFNEIGGVRNVNVTVAEPLRINGGAGYQTMAEAKDSHTGADVMVIQWLRFGGGGYLQMIGVGPADTWTNVLARLRTVRDSVELR